GRLEAGATATDQPDAAGNLIAGEADPPADALAQLGLGRLDTVALAAPPGIGEQPARHLRQLPMRGGGRQPDRGGIAPDVVLDMPADPADRISRQPSVEAVGIE